MRYIRVRDLRRKSAEIWRDLPAEREMVVTRHGRPIAILAAVGDTDVETVVAAFRQARAIDVVARLQRDAIAAGLDRLSPEDVEIEIRSVRQQLDR